MEHKQNNSTADHDHDLSNNNGHEGNEDHKHSGHDHMGHMEHMGNLKHKFWISLIITFPILLLSSFMGIEVLIGWYLFFQLHSSFMVELHFLVVP